MIAPMLDSLASYLGTPVETLEGDPLGVLWNVAVDEINGSLAYAIVRTQHGSQEKWVGFLWNEFRPNPEGTRLQIAFTQEAMDLVPGIDPQDCPHWFGHPVRLLTEALPVEGPAIAGRLFQEDFAKLKR